MQDDDDDAAFERFLQEGDDDSLSALSDSFKMDPPAGTARKSSTAGGISKTARPTAVSGSKKKKDSGSSGRKASKKATYSSDSEGPPPSYSSGRGSARDPDADPYAFDLDSSFHLRRSNDDDDPKNKKKKKKKKESEAKGKTKKEPPREVLSLEDRVAQILKRNGSSAYVPPVAQDDVDDDQDEQEEKEEEVRAAPALDAKRDESEYESDKYDDKRLSLSDSLGMESADFEVGVQAKRKFERSRLSLSSLNSEKFAVNIDALEESELVAHSRYRNPNIGASDDDAGNTTNGTDEYGEDDFELDHTTIDATALALEIRSRTNENADIREEKNEEPPSSPFVSQFDKMKSFFSVDPVDPPIDLSSEKVAATDEQNDEQYSSANANEDDNEASDQYGYDDEDFETEEERKELVVSVISAQIVDQDSKRDSMDFGEDGFDKEHALITDPAEAEANERLKRAMEAFAALDQHELDHEKSNDDTLRLEKGQEYHSRKREEDESANPSDIVPFKNQHQIEDGILSPPMSPPPPPPPEEEPDDDEFASFSLTPHTAQPPSSYTLDQSSQEHASSQHKRSALSVSDRFRQIQDHVASLDLSQRSHPAESSFSGSRLINHQTQARLSLQQQSRPVQRKDYHPTVTPPSPPNEQIVAELQEEMEGIEEFMNKSRRIHEDRHKTQSVRASTSKENELVLRLQQAHRHILQLKRHIQDTEAEAEHHVTYNFSNTPIQNTTEDIGTAAEDGLVTAKIEEHDIVSIPRSVYTNMQKEIKTQENLINAFQRENEQLMRQQKQIQQDLQYDVHTENVRLKEQIQHMQAQIDKQDSSTAGNGTANIDNAMNKAQYRAAFEARLHAEAYALSLQEQLDAARVAHQERENELKLDLDRVKKAKVDLECKYGGIDLDKVQEESQQLKSQQAVMHRQKKEYEHSMAAIQKKLDWYVENQRLLDEQDAELKSLKDERTQLMAEIQVLRSKPEQQRRKSLSNTTPAASPLKSSARQAYHRSAADIRRIQELESRLNDMEEAMRRRHPDSLVNLILASRKAEEESKIKAMEVDFQLQISAMEEEIEQLQAQNETKIKSFRQQQEKLVLQYQKRITELEQMLHKRETHPFGQKTTPQKRKQTAHDADELKRVRKFYADKMKEIERKWEVKYRSLRAQKYGSIGKDERNADLSYADSVVVITNLQQRLREKDAETKKLKAQLLDQGDMTPSSNPYDTNERSASEKSLKEQIQDLEMQLKSSEEARAHLVLTLSTLQTIGEENLPDKHRHEVQAAVSSSQALSQEHEQDLRQRIIAELESIFDTKMRIERKQFEDHLAQANARATNAEQQLLEQSNARMKAMADHVAEVERLQKSIAEAVKDRHALENAAARVPFLESEVIRLQSQMSIPQTPSMLQYRSLELQIETLTQKHQLREAELNVLLQQAMQSRELEKLNSERVHQHAIAMKNAEIKQFKQQLDDIVSELERLQQTP